LRATEFAPVGGADLDVLGNDAAVAVGCPRDGDSLPLAQIAGGGFNKIADAGLIGEKDNFGPPFGGFHRDAVFINADNFAGNHPAAVAVATGARAIVRRRAAGHSLKISGRGKCRRAFAFLIFHSAEKRSSPNNCDCQQTNEYVFAHVSN